MSQACARNSTRRGFTLVELCVVITVIGIAAAMVVMNAGSSSMAADAAAQAIGADLRYAQNLAVTHQKDIIFSCDTANRSYSLSDSGGLLTHPVYRKDYTVELSNGEGFGSVTLMTDLPSDQVTFSLDGSPTPAEGGNILVYGPSSFYKVTVNAVTGNVTVQKF